MIGPSGHELTVLPIDGTSGFPQEFPFLFEGRTYFIRLYVNVLREELTGKDAFLMLPTDAAALIARVERLDPSGKRKTIFLRKVVPGLEYAVEDIVIAFPLQGVAGANINGTGEFGTRVMGGMRRRWA